VLQEIDRAAARGYAVDRGEFFNGIGGAAVALRDGYGEPIAAISVIVPSEQLDEILERQIAERLLIAAAQLEASTQTAARGGQVLRGGAGSARLPAASA
jgi:DNA-binding IclR family transcriptional regulator